MGALALDSQCAPAAGGMKLGAAKASSIFHEGWIDLNKNGRMDVYEDPSQPLEKRVEDLLGQMTLQEKLGQGKSSQFSEIVRAGVGLIAQGGCGAVSNCQSVEHRNVLQRAAVETSRLGVPLLFDEAANPGAGEQAQSVGLRLSKEGPSQDLDGSVRKVLRAKFLKGLFEKPYLLDSQKCEAPVKAA